MTWGAPVVCVDEVIRLESERFGGAARNDPMEEPAAIFSASHDAS